MTDDSPEHEQSSDYPWYRLVADGSLEQRDILFAFPSVSVKSSYIDITRDNIDFDIVSYDVIILTQSCDLAAGKVEHVLLCPLFSQEQLASKINALAKPDGLKSVHRGRVESLYLLPPCQVGEIELPPRIVNFRQVLTVPFDHIAEHASRQENRARLCPPYREHLAQAFARFIMRIGFPIDFNL